MNIDFMEFLLVLQFISVTRGSLSWLLVSFWLHNKLPYILFHALTIVYRPTESYFSSYGSNQCDAMGELQF